MNQVPNFTLRERIIRIPEGEAIGLDRHTFLEAFPGEHYGAMERLALALGGHKEVVEQTPEQQAAEFAQENGLVFEHSIGRMTYTFLRLDNPKNTLPGGSSHGGMSVGGQKHQMVLHGGARLGNKSEIYRRMVEEGRTEAVGDTSWLSLSEKELFEKQRMGSWNVDKPKS